ncbi:MAG TPA: hypothetical protein VJV05_04095, partial [Pyrinomonadaceae bacterium]|nr:hypothetical protein [Pyrinomonadaceae bacterium]
TDWNAGVSPASGKALKFLDCDRLTSLRDVAGGTPAFQSISESPPPVVALPASFAILTPYGSV